MQNIPQIPTVLGPRSSTAAGELCRTQQEAMGDLFARVALLWLLVSVGVRLTGALSSHQQPPDFYLIGVQKCATTSLHHMITTHPDVCKPRVKEPHFFDRHPIEDGPGFWPDHFYKDDCDGPYVDGTPAYFSIPEVPIRMYKAFPPETRSKKKFVVILRDPVARAYSWYHHNIYYCVLGQMRAFFHAMEDAKKTMPKEGWDISKTDICSEKHCVNLLCGKNSNRLVPGNESAVLASFAQFVDLPSGKEATGFYTTSLSHWLTHFRRDQILILNFEYVIEHPAEAANKMALHYGLSPSFPPNATMPGEAGPKHKRVMDCATRDKLVKRYAEHVQDLYDYMERTPAADKPPMEPPFGRFNHAAKCSNEPQR